jgi:hypothetical protein
MKQIRYTYKEVNNPNYGKFTVRTPVGVNKKYIKVSGAPDKGYEV